MHLPFFGVEELAEPELNPPPPTPHPTSVLEQIPADRFQDDDDDDDDA